MANTLITFLGRVSKDEGHYRTTQYDFGDGRLSEPVAFLGWPLTERLNPDHLVILGTTGSMWDHLFEVDHDLGNQWESERLALIEATSHGTVSSRHLTQLEPLLRDRFRLDVKLRLIPYCRNESEQVELLRSLADHVDAGDKVHIDITHGFRTLPMVSVMAALYLRRVRSAEITGIWYGFYDPDTKKATVHDLKGLLHIADWLEALAIYDRNGDYGAFVDLVGSAGKSLKRAAFFERTSNPGKAVAALSGWASRDDRIPDGDAAADLLVTELERRISWRRGPRVTWEKELARTYLEKGDYVRASIYGLEGVVTTIAKEKNLNDQDYQTREDLRGELRKTKDFKVLNHLRNCLAHVTRPTMKEVALALKDEDKLRRLLKNLFDALF